MFSNPFDISKDRKNNFTDGIRFHIRQSEENKQKIKDYIEKWVTYSGNPSPLEILDYAMGNLNIPDSELTIADEHELLDWIHYWKG